MGIPPKRLARPGRSGKTPGVPVSHGQRRASAFRRLLNLHKRERVRRAPNRLNGGPAARFTICRAVKRSNGPLKLGYWIRKAPDLQSLVWRLGTIPLGNGRGKASAVRRNDGERDRSDGAAGARI